MKNANIDRMLRELAAKDKSMPGWINSSAKRLVELVELQAPICTIQRELEILTTRVNKYIRSQNVWNK